MKRDEKDMISLRQPNELEADQWTSLQIEWSAGFFNSHAFQCFFPAVEFDDIQ